MFYDAAAQTTGANPTQRSSTAADKAYSVDIKNKLRSNVAYDDRSDGVENPSVVYLVHLLPTGDVMSVDRVRSSGLPDFDSAVQRGIWKASPLPKRRDGKVEHALVVEYWMKDQSQAGTVAK